MAAGDDRLSFIERRVAAGLDVREHILAPGVERPFDDGEWEDALVVVEQGQLEVECRGGTLHRFECGDVLWLVGLPLSAMRNPGEGRTVLSSVSRRL